MAKNNVADLLSVGSLFTTQAERDEAQRETIRDIPLEEISDFPNHPFKVRMDASMMEMVDSVKQHGVLVPALVRPKPDGGYEMIAGHRRRKASELAEKQTLSCIVRDMTDDEATIVMVDSNLQREQILPSEKAFAYKMKLDAMKRQAGRPSKDNLRPVGADLIGTRSDELLAENSPDSARQIQRYIRLIGKKFVEKAELFLRFRGRAAVLMKMCSTHLLLRGLFSQQLLLRFREKKRKDC